MEVWSEIAGIIQESCTKFWEIEYNNYLNNQRKHERNKLSLQGDNTIDQALRTNYTII